MIIVNMPDGTILRFPDGTSQEVMRNAIQSLDARDAQAGLMGQNTTGTPSGGVSVNQAAAAELGQNIGAIEQGITSAAIGANNQLFMGAKDAIDGAFIGGIGGGVAQPDGSIDMFNYGTPVGDRYASVRDMVRNENTTAQEASPTAHMLGSIGGGILPSVVGFSATQAPTFLGTLGRMVGLGGAEGGLLGYNNADGEDTFANTLLGAGLGMGFGLLAPGAVAIGRAGGRTLGGAFDTLRSRASPGRAGVALDRVVQRSGKTLGDIDAAIQSAFADGQNEFRIADALGNPGQRALSGVARAPGDGRTAIVDFLGDRQLGQKDRVSSFVGDALQTSDTAALRAAEQTRIRRGDAGVNYTAARNQAGAVDVRPALAVIDGRLGPLRDSGIKLGPEDVRLEGFRSRLSVPPSRLAPGVSAMDLSDFNEVMRVKVSLNDAIEEASRAGRGGEALTLATLRDALDASLEDASAGYRLANDTYRQQSRAIDAIQTGRDAVVPTVRTEDALRAYRALPPSATPIPPNSVATVPMTGLLGPDERAGFRLGYVDPLLARIENTTPTSNSIRQFLTPKNQEVMAEIATDPALFARRMDNERTMFQTGFEALGGSKTADNIADAVDVQGIDVGLISNILAGRYGAALGSIAQRGANAAKGLSEETRALIAQALLSSDPQAILGPLLQRAMLSNRNASAAEAAIRQSAFQGALSQGSLTQGLLGPS